MANINIDWNGIRTIGGSAKEGFEELCSQLARLECPPAVAFERNGKPDGGVECYYTFPDGKEWGWQAKYFKTLGDSQWGQLDESVKRALECYPTLNKYYVCIPLDRANARNHKTKSAMDRWNDRVRKWQGWADGKGMEVEFVYWGSSELIDMLSRPQNIGLVRFWFDVHLFDPAWFSEKLEQAVKSAGPRYTPEIHVDLPLAMNFEALGRTEFFQNSIKSKVPRLRKAVVGYERSFGPELVGGSRTEAEVFFDEGLLGVRQALVGKITWIIDEITRLHLRPTGKLPFQPLVEGIEDALKMGGGHEREIWDAEDKWKNEQEVDESLPYRRANRFDRVISHLSTLMRVCEDVRQLLVQTATYAENDKTILTGRAGTGKTHLLCDVASQRVAVEAPTILLMGQQFVEKGSPWRQTLEQLDLAHLSAEEFIGALEAAAQSSGKRAIVLIDALNEGAGRELWPSNLSSYLAQFDKSDWISVVMSIRSPFEEVIIPRGVQKEAASLYHEGFSEHMPKAVDSFFKYYGIEAPSAPLLNPEFNNPLFLKVLCKGLRASGRTQLPRGTFGISNIFGLFLGAVNEELAEKLDYNPKTLLVKRAIKKFIKMCVDRGERWLPLEEAEEEINKLLPAQGYANSLYRGLVASGVFIEESFTTEKGRRDAVLLSYERMSDHFTAQHYLEEFLSKDEPEGAFNDGAPLSFLDGKEEYVSPGLVEAFCIQLPEECGKELPEVLPSVKSFYSYADAFFASVVFRSPDAVSDKTIDIINELLEYDYNTSRFIDVLLTVATVEGHPLNARELHRVLNQYSLPERDSWWTLAVSKSWEYEGTVARVVNWAWNVKSEDSLDSESVELCSIALAWLLASSHRYLRDRATKALVCLLTDRFAELALLIESFKDVNDPYILERVYAVAYGCCMRSWDAEMVGGIASQVYQCVFEGGKPTPHILLRDYARGVIERANYLGAEIGLEPKQYQPPYNSTWPHIPTEQEVEQLIDSWKDEKHEDTRIAWARSTIESSVMSGDFGRYVIGTNFGRSSWLDVPLSEPKWLSSKAQLDQLVENLDEDGRVVWEALVKHEHSGFIYNFPMSLFKGEDEDESDSSEKNTPEYIEFEERRAELLDLLEYVVGAEQATKMLELNNSSSDAPHFDLKKIQRYVLWRVFDLGWDIDRFAHYDQYEVSFHGRHASKAERVGKKYQWIAYHEIIAYISDHYQRKTEGSFRTEGRPYVGGWEGSYRDIDPSCVIRAKKVEDPDLSPTPWWKVGNVDWATKQTHREWIQDISEMPSIQEQLQVVNPVDGTVWFNLDGYLNWSEPTPPEFEYGDLDRRECWFLLYGYIIKKADGPSFLKWAQKVNFWNRWMPEPVEHYRLFLGEYGWSQAEKYFDTPYWGEQGWQRPDKGCPVDICVPAIGYLKESTSFDCSIDEGYQIKLPSNALRDLIGAKWSSWAGDHLNAQGELIAFDPSVDAEGPSALLVKRDLLQEALDREGLSLCWAVTGERIVYPAGFGTDRRWDGRMQLTGAYILNDGIIHGFMNDEFVVHG